MSEEEALLKAILAKPDEDTPRLVYAEWLIENASDRPGLTGRQMQEKAEFIRLQIELGRPGAKNPKLEAREKELLHDMIAMLKLGSEITTFIAREPYRISFSRGFLHNLDLRHSPIIKLPDGLHVGGDLDLSRTRITSLPEGLHVGGNLNLWGTRIARLPEGLNVGRNLDLSVSQITSLPEGLNVGGYLDLSGTRITTLPEGLHVGDWLNLWGMPITRLPDKLQVGGDLYLSRIVLSPETARRILDMPGLSDRAKVTGLRTAGFEELAQQAERNAAMRPPSDRSYAGPASGADGTTPGHPAKWQGRRTDERYDAIDAPGRGKSSKWDPGR